MRAVSIMLIGLSHYILFPSASVMSAEVPWSTSVADTLWHDNDYQFILSSTSLCITPSLSINVSCLHRRHYHHRHSTKQQNAYRPTSDINWFQLYPLNSLSDR